MPAATLAPVTARRSLLAVAVAVAVAAAAGLLTPGAARADFTTTTFIASGVALTADDGGNAIVLDAGGGVLRHDQAGAGFASAVDFDSTTAGDQPIDATASILTVVGGAGDDLVVLRQSSGGMTFAGQGGTDRVLVEGSATEGDRLAVTPGPGGITVSRADLTPFAYDLIAERVTLHAGGGADTVTAAPGLAGRTRLEVDGGEGDDTIGGGDGDDVLLGGPGADVVTGGAGADLLDGAAGADRLLARDGEADLLICGPEVDGAQVDEPRVDAVAGCESVDAAAGPAEPAPDTTATPVRVRTGPVRTRRGVTRARLRVRCPASEPGGCAGRVTLTTAGAVRGAGIRAPAVLGSAAFALGRGAAGIVRVRLPRNVRRLAGGSGRLAVRARTDSRDGAGNVALTVARLTLRLAGR